MRKTTLQSVRWSTIAGEKGQVNHSVTIFVSKPAKAQPFLILSKGGINGMGTKLEVLE